MKRRARALWASAFALVVVALVGCSGGKTASSGSGASTTTGALATTGTSASSKTSPTQSPPGPQANAQFVARADAMCQRLNAEIASVKAKNSSPKEVERIVPRNVALEREGIARLEKLTPPASLQGAWRQMLGYRRTLAAELARLLDFAKARNATAIKSLTISKKYAHNALSKLATANGFKDCAKVGTVG